MREGDPRLARYFASRTVDFWPLLLLEDEIESILRDLPPYPLISELALRRRGFHELLSVYLSELGVGVESGSLSEDELLERVRDAYAGRFGPLGRLIGNLAARRRITKILEEAKYTKEGLEIAGERYLKNWIAFIRSYIPILGLEGFLYTAGNLPLSVHSAALWLSSYLIAYGPLTALSYRLKMAGELGKSRVIDTVRTLVWVLRSPLMALETLLELRYGGKLLHRVLEGMERRSGIPHLLAEAITNGNVPLGPVILALNWPPGERPLIRRRASEEVIKGAFLRALRRIGESGTFASELVEDTMNKVEEGLIPVRRLEPELIGETGRLELVSGEALPMEQHMHEWSEGFRDDERGLPLIFDGEGRLRPFWYGVAITDLYSGDYLHAIAMKEAYALLIFRRYEWMAFRS